MYRVNYVQLIRLSLSALLSALICRILTKVRLCWLEILNCAVIVSYSLLVIEYLEILSNVAMLVEVVDEAEKLKKDGYRVASLN